MYISYTILQSRKTRIVKLYTSVFDNDIEAITSLKSLKRHSRSNGAAPTELGQEGLNPVIAYRAGCWNAC
jgi:hypothetical protein